MPSVWYLQLTIPKVTAIFLACLLSTVLTKDLHIYLLDAVPPVHVVSKHVDTDKLTTANGGTFTSSSASLSSQ